MHPQAKRDDGMPVGFNSRARGICVRVEVAITNVLAAAGIRTAKNNYRVQNFPHYGHPEMDRRVDPVQRELDRAKR